MAPPHKVLLTGNLHSRRQRPPNAQKNVTQQPHGQGGAGGGVAEADTSVISWSEGMLKQRKWLQGQACCAVGAERKTDQCG